MSKAKKPSVAILHYSCPPVIGGVEFVIQAHARLLADAGYKTKLIVGSGDKVHLKADTVVIPEIVSKGGPLHQTLATLADGLLPNSFDSGVARTEAKLRSALQGVDVCMMHNVLLYNFQ